jgi:GNAT superfamily N-acetyltransferase
MEALVRRAVLDDVTALQCLIERSVSELQYNDYTPEQRGAALKEIYGVDTALISDGTYFVAEVDGVIVAGGGWSKRKTLFGGDIWSHRENDLLDPATNAAKIRAFFVHPTYARRGLGSLLLDRCEREGRQQGFTRFEMGATLTGLRLYERHGYVAVDRFDVKLSNGEAVAVVRMVKGAISPE